MREWLCGAISRMSREHCELQEMERQGSEEQKQSSVLGQYIPSNIIGLFPLVCTLQLSVASRKPCPQLRIVYTSPSNPVPSIARLSHAPMFSPCTLSTSLSCPSSPLFPHLSPALPYPPIPPPTPAAAASSRSLPSAQSCSLHWAATAA